MSGQTAARWFVPDDEYDLATDDYCFCVQNNAMVKNWLLRLEDRQGPLPDGIDTWYSYVNRWGPWFPNKNGSGCLIYADAKERNIIERGNFIQARAKVPLLEKLPLELQEVDKGLITWIKDEKLLKDLPLPQGEDLDRYADAPARRIIGRETGSGFIPSDYIDYIVSQNDPRKRTDILTLLSRQGYTQTQRPTVLLIAAVSDVFTAPGTQQRGYVTIYDMTKEVFVTKSYAFDRNQYVLAESWSSKDSDDSFYACDTLRSFISNLKVPEAALTADRDALLRLFTQSLVCKWLQKHKKVFKLSEEDVARLKKQMEAIKKYLESQKLPALGQLELVKKSEALNDLSAMLEQLELAEDQLRDTAVRAKEDGLETTADNLAKHFERMIRDLTQMVEHPELPLED